MEVKTIAEFTELLGVELYRYSLKGELVNSVECTEENMFNLYNSQFEDKTRYGEVYRYHNFKKM